MSTLAYDSGLFTMSEFRNRGVVKLAPDVLVYISGSTGSRVVAPVASSDQKLDFNDGITSVSVQNNIDPPGSSTASIEITTPIYGEYSNYWISFDDPDTGRTTRIPFFVTMQEVKIFFKGRFLSGMRPKYYPAFWGFVTNVEENFSGGVWKLTLQCADMLHWWAYSQINVHPIPESNVAAGGGLTLTAYSTIFKQANPYTILWTLSQDMGMHTMVVPTWVGSPTPLSSIYKPKAFRAAATGIMEYWRERFGNMSSLLKMYGMNGNEISLVGPDKGRKRRGLEPDIEINTEDAGASAKKEASRARTTSGFSVNDDYLKGFQVFFEFDKMGEFSDTNYMSKLEIATEVKTRSDFEFFQDVNGNWVFKPPFYNLNTKTLYPYNIKSHDILNSSFSVDSEAITTVLEVELPFHPNIRDGSTLKKGYHMDIDLANRYGVRYKRMNLEFLIKDNSRVGNQMAMAYLSLTNAKAFTGSVTIPGRPEIRLGYPVYIEHRDSFHYVKSINHTFDYGGTFTTTLALEAERKKFWELTEGDKWKLLKDHVWEYLGPGATAKKPQKPPTIEESPLNEMQTKAYNLRQSTGQTASIKMGRYKKVPRTQTKALLSQRDLVNALAVTERTVPLTDEEGYRVIGGFRYGRGVLVRPKTYMEKGDVEIDESFSSSALVVNRQALALADMGVTTNYATESKAMEDIETSTENSEGLVPKPLTSFRINDGKNFRKSASNQDSADNEAEKVTNAQPSGETKKNNSKLVNSASSKG